jgi:hypothetical protein
MTCFFFPYTQAGWNYYDHNKTPKDYTTFSESELKDWNEKKKNAK